MRGDVITGKLNDIGPADLHGARWSAILLQEPCLLLPSAADDVRFQPRHKIRSKLCMFFPETAACLWTTGGFSAMMFHTSSHISMEKVAEYDT